MDPCCGSCWILVYTSIPPKNMPPSQQTFSSPPQPPNFIYPTQKKTKKNCLAPPSLFNLPPKLFLTPLFFSTPSPKKKSTPPLTASAQLIPNQKSYQVSKPVKELRMRMWSEQIIFSGKTIKPSGMRAQTEKTTFPCKDDCTLTKHTWLWTYSALRYFFCAA